MGSQMNKVKKVKLAKIEALKKAGVDAYPDIAERPGTIVAVKKQFDELVRRADVVLIVTKTGLGAGRLLQLAHRYAKTVRVIRLNSKTRASGTPAG